MNFIAFQKILLQQFFNRKFSAKIPIDIVMDKQFRMIWKLRLFVAESKF